MKKSLPLLYLLMLFSIISRSQQRNIVIDKLLSDLVNETNISGFSGDFSQFVDPAFISRPGYFLKSGKHLFCWFTSSGRLYEAKRNKDSSVQFIRLDSTVMEGYNICAFPFAYQSQLFNFGGYGFWRTNGQLRKYNVKDHEWDIVLLNREVPLFFSENEGCIWMNHKAGKLYLAFSLVREEAIKKGREIIPDVNVLDLKTKNWQKLGDISKELKEKYADIHPIAMLSAGLLCSMKDQVYLISFEQNKMYRLKKNYPLERDIVRSQYKNIFFESGGKLFIGDLLNNRLDSIPVSLNDFEHTGIAVYNKPNYFVPIGLSVFFLISIGWGAVKFRKRQAEKTITSNKFSHPEDYVNLNKLEYLNERELQVLNLVYKNSCTGKLTTIEELNNIMGLTQKGMEIQKKQRSDMILSINHQMTYLIKNPAPVITKRRSDFDKRTFEYFINPEMMQTVGKFLEA